MEKTHPTINGPEASDFRVRGLVVIKKEDGTVVLEKENMIVGTGRSYISGLVSGAIAESLSDSTNISGIKFGTGGSTVPASSQTALASWEPDYDTTLDTTLVWKKSILNVYSGTYGAGAPSGGSNGDYYLRTGSTSPGLYLKTSGTWGIVTLSANSYFRSTSDTKVFIYTHSTTSWDDGTNGVSGEEFSDFASPSEGDAFYRTDRSTLYIYSKAFTVSNLISPVIGLRFDCTIRGIVGSEANISELGLFLSDGAVVADESVVVGKMYKIKTVGTTNWNTVFGTSGVSYSIGNVGKASAVGSGTGDAYLIDMFSRLAFDQIPLTDDLDAYNISYYVYF